TNVNARWIAALANAGRMLACEEWVARAARALDTLTSAMQTPEGVFAHYRVDGGEPQIDFLLIDTLAVADAAMALAEADAGAEWVGRTRELARTLERCFWADDGGFWERRRSPHDVGALRYRERPFEPNALAARLLVRLANATGQRGPRARAERVLAVLSRGAWRYGVAGATFALAVGEFFGGARRRGAMPSRDLHATVRTALRAPADATLVDSEFDALALGIFRHQFENNAPYRAYCERRGRTPSTVTHWTEVPPVPVAAFREVALV